MSSSGHTAGSGARRLASRGLVTLGWVYGLTRTALLAVDVARAQATPFHVVFLVLELLLLTGVLRAVWTLRETCSRSQQVDRILSEPPSADEPWVDILIPTRGEPLELLERSLVGALGQTYRSCRVWVLDDAARAEVAELVASFASDRLRYFARSEHTGAKAGNLNAGLAHARARGDAGAYVAVLDADFVARPAFIRRALALFQDDPQVALVQTPQAYCNCDNFQRAFPRGRLPDSLRFVYETSLPARDVAGLANCLGTSFVVRRDALELVDGFPLESVTEDVVLSFKLWSAGYKTRYLNERLTRGWATDTLGEHLAQRERWALGFTQLANWQFGRRVGRSLGKRLLTYEACTRIVYSNIVRAIVTLVPVAYFWFGVTPWNLRPQTFYGLLVPLVVLHRWFLSRISVGRFVSGLSDAAFFLGAPGALRGLIMAFLPGTRRFRVTSKAKPKGAVCVHWSSLAWSGFPLALLLVGMLRTQSRAQPLSGGWGLLASEGGMMFVWGLASLAVLTIAVLLSIELPERRRQPRLLCPGPAWLAGRSAFVERLDTQAAQIQLLDGHFKPDTGAELSFEVGGRVFEVKVARASAGRIVVTFPNDTETRRALIRTAYVVGEEPDWQGSSELELLRGVGWRLLPSAGWRASG